jgi:hypothetical protein
MLFDSRRLRLRAGLGLFVFLGTCTLFLVSCGNDEQLVDYRSACRSGARFSVGGQVGSFQFSTVKDEPIEGRMGEDFFNLVLEEAESPHLISFSTRGTEGEDIRSHLLARYESGVQNAEVMTVVSRPTTVPCDTAEGVICANYGIDSNFDGKLYGANEAIYPVEEGELTFTQSPGQVLAAEFTIVFGPQETGDEELGGEVGGTLNGCFVLYTSPDLSRVY